MNNREAKRLLALYRPDAGETPGPEVTEAINHARRDPELRQWFETHCAFQNAMRKNFRQIKAPAGLKERILENRKVIRPTVWRHPARWLALAAAIALLLGLAAFWIGPAPTEDFGIYQSRMVGAVLREYRMDIMTDDPVKVRGFLAARKAPSDFVLPDDLGELKVMGAGLLRWQDRPVSMVCFDRGDSEMLFLFVVDAGSIKSPPPSSPVVKHVNKLLTASWTREDKTYLLAGPPDTELPRTFYP